jgi:hypothetical protein
VPDWPPLRVAQRQERALDNALGDNAQRDGLASSDGFATGPNVKGTWHQLFASVPFDAAGFFVMALENNAGVYFGLMDFGVGPVGFEEVIVPDILWGNYSPDWTQEHFFVPMPLKGGSRLVCRVQVNSSQGYGWAGEVMPIATSWPGIRPFSRAISMGTNPVDSQGVTLTANYPGGWTSIIDPVDAGGFEAILISSYMLTGHTSGFKVFVDVGLSAAGAGSPSHVIAGPIPLSAKSAGFGDHFINGAFPIHVPGGSKLWMRATNAGQGGQTLTASIVGFR